MTAGFSPPVEVTWAPSVAVVAAMPVAATVSTAGATGRVSKLADEKAQESPVVLVARVVK